MIVGFADKHTEALFHGQRVKRYQAFERQALRKLKMLSAAGSLDVLREVPGNRLELLAGDRKGLYSIRINDQWRICFRWLQNDASDVEIADYH